MVHSQAKPSHKQQITQGTTTYINTLIYLQLKWGLIICTLFIPYYLTSPMIMGTPPRLNDFCSNLITFK